MSAIFDVSRFLRSRPSWLQGSRAWFGFCVPRFSHRESLRFHVSPRFSSTCHTSTPQFLRPSTDSKTRQVHCFSIPYFLEPCGSPRIQRIAYPQMPKIHDTKSQMCVFWADATQLTLSAGIRQSNRRLCSLIGCWSRAPAGSDQSKAVENCTVTADPKVKPGL